jgi:hypothetical protein
MPESTFLCLLSQLLTINTQEKAQPNPHKRIKKEERQKRKKKPKLTEPLKIHSCKCSSDY